MSLFTRIGESASAPGLGTVTLLGALSGYFAWDDSQGIGSGSLTNIPVIYILEDAANAATFEIGRGLYTKSGATKTLARSTVRKSSSAGAKVNFGGTVNVYCTIDDRALGPEGTSRSYGLTAGTSTAYTLTMRPTISELVDGMAFFVEWHAACGDNPTLNVDSKGAKNLKFFDGASIYNDSLPSGGRDIVQYRSATDDFRLIGRVGSAQWTSYTPTITAATGTITSYTINSAKFRRAGTSIDVQVYASMTNIGSAGAALFITQPAPWAAGSVVGYGGNPTQAQSALVTIESTRFVYRKYDGTFGVNSGDNIAMFASYETNA